MNNIWSFIHETVSQPGVLWAAIEAIATTIALIVIIFELKRIRRENARQNVEGVKYIVVQLNAPDFKGWMDVILDVYKTAGNKYPRTINPQISSVLARLDYVARIVDMGYIDKKLFNYMISDELYILACAITLFEQAEDSGIPSLKKDYPNGYKLVKDIYRRHLLGPVKKLKRKLREFLIIGRSKLRHIFRDMISKLTVF